MRKYVIAGNWKMFKTREEAVQFMLEVAPNVPSSDLVETVICTPFPVLRCCVKRQGDNLRIGAQNVHFEDSGAYTGEVSAVLLQDLNVEYVIIGHSERRAMFNETDYTVNLKIKQALIHGIKPIICVGESLETRESGTTYDFIKNQVVEAFKGISKEDAKNLIIAYEPIWAIGTGKTATKEVAEETCKDIRSIINELYDNEVKDSIRILYGGSANPANIDDLLSQEDIDGALIGGASLVPEKYLSMVRAALNH